MARIILYWEFYWSFFILAFEQSPWDTHQTKSRGQHTDFPRDSPTIPSRVCCCDKTVEHGREHPDHTTIPESELVHYELPVSVIDRDMRAVVYAFA